MSNHDEFDLNVRFMPGGGMEGSEQPGAQIAGYTGQATCPGYHSDCGTCAGDTRPCATCQTNCGHTCLNTCQTCAADTGGCQGCNPPPSPLTTTFSGLASIGVYDPNTPNNPTWTAPYYVQPVSLSLTFSGDRTSVSLNPSSFQFTIPLQLLGIAIGPDTLTAHLSSNGTGSYSSASGSMQIPMTLTLDHHYLAYDLFHPTATSSLTTGQASTPDGQITNSGFPLNAQGQVSLVAGFQMQSSSLDYFNNVDLFLGFEGSISPHP